MIVAPALETLMEMGRLISTRPDRDLRSLVTFREHAESISQIVGGVELGFTTALLATRSMAASADTPWSGAVR
jgi:hypothetical protein